MCRLAHCRNEGAGGKSGNRVLAPSLLALTCPGCPTLNGNFCFWWSKFSVYGSTRLVLGLCPRHPRAWQEDGPQSSIAQTFSPVLSAIPGTVSVAGRGCLNVIQLTDLSSENFWLLENVFTDHLPDMEKCCRPRTQGRASLSHWIQALSLPACCASWEQSFQCVQYLDYFCKKSIWNKEEMAELEKLSISQSNFCFFFTSSFHFTCSWFTVLPWLIGQHLNQRSIKRHPLLLCRYFSFSCSSFTDVVYWLYSFSIFRFKARMFFLPKMVPRIEAGNCFPWTTCEIPSQRQLHLGRGMC